MFLFTNRTELQIRWGAESHKSNATFLCFSTTVLRQTVNLLQRHFREIEPRRFATARERFTLDAWNSREHRRGHVRRILPCDETPGSIAFRVHGCTMHDARRVSHSASCTRDRSFVAVVWICGINLSLVPPRARNFKEKENYICWEFVFNIKKGKEGLFQSLNIKYFSKWKKK